MNNKARKPIWAAYVRLVLGIFFILLSVANLFWLDKDTPTRFLGGQTLDDNSLLVFRALTLFGLLFFLFITIKVIGRISQRGVH